MKNLLILNIIVLLLTFILSNFRDYNYFNSCNQTDDYFFEDTYNPNYLRNQGIQSNKVTCDSNNQINLYYDTKTSEFFQNMTTTSPLRSCYSYVSPVYRKEFCSNLTYNVPTGKPIFAIKRFENSMCTGETYFIQYVYKNCINGYKYTVSSFGVQEQSCTDKDCNTCNGVPLVFFYKFCSAIGYSNFGNFGFAFVDSGEKISNYLFFYLLIFSFYLFL
jgi:hypothetical protein